MIKRAKEIAGTYIENNSFESVSRVIEVLVQGYTSNMEKGLKIENEKFGELFLTQDAKEGVEAFAEKRKPNFKHN